MVHLHKFLLVSSMYFIYFSVLLDYSFPLLHFQSLLNSFLVPGYKQCFTMTKANPIFGAYADVSATNELLRRALCIIIIWYLV